MNQQDPRRPDGGLRTAQARLRSRYLQDPAQALVTDLAWTSGESELHSPMQGRVHFGSHATGQLDFGVHQAIGGTHEGPVPGDLLCAALASCQESSLRMVAAVLGVQLLGLRVRVRGEVDVRGTLGDPLVPVAFHAFHVSVRLHAAPDTQPQRLRQLYRAAERSCVVLQTLRTGAPVVVEFHGAQAEPLFTQETLHDRPDHSRP